MTGAGATAPPAAGADGVPLSLGEVAVALYDDLRLSRILSRLLDESGRLLGVDAGSVSIVDAAGARYAKAAERGAACQLGQSFPLDEGVTGRVAQARRPVVLARYSDIGSGHLPAAHSAARGAVAAVPIWWRGDVLGVNVAFAGRDRTFSCAEIDRFELLSQVGAAGIVSAAAADPALPDLLCDRRSDDAPRPPPLVVTEVGAVAHRDAGTAATARTLVSVVERALRPVAATTRLRVVLLHRHDGLRVLLHDEGGALAGAAATLQELQQAWSQVASSHSGTVTVERVPGWGVLVLADLPHGGSRAAPSPLSRREDEVLRLLAQGLTDPQVADGLFVARKTVEKHVSALLRKTGTSSRTAAVVRALELGWLPPLRRS